MCWVAVKVLFQGNGRQVVVAIVVDIEKSDCAKIACQLDGSDVRMLDSELGPV